MELALELQNYPPKGSRVSAAQILWGSLLLNKPDKPDKSAFRLNFPEPVPMPRLWQMDDGAIEKRGSASGPGDFLFAGMPLMLTLLRPSTASSALQPKKVLTARKSDEIGNSSTRAYRLLA